MIADSGSRLVFADADTVTAVRGAVQRARGGRGHRDPAGSIEGDLWPGW